MFSIITPQYADSAKWSDTEIQLQYGKLKVPEFAGGGKKSTAIATFQHSSGWEYGDNYFYIDISATDENHDIYGEWYSGLSFNKITNKKVGISCIDDIGLVFGLNCGADSNVRKFLPGGYISWKLPGFSFLKTKFMWYIDDNDGIRSGGAPRTKNGFMVDASWLYPFQIKNAKFTIEGHIEYLTSRQDELGHKSSWWILGQPQLQWHITDNIAIGAEWQFWLNKLGDKHTNENAPQLLLVWTF